MKITNKNSNWGDTIASIQEKRVYDEYTYTYVMQHAAMFLHTRVLLCAL